MSKEFLKCHAQLSGAWKKSFITLGFLELLFMATQSLLVLIRKVYAFLKKYKQLSNCYFSSKNLIQDKLYSLIFVS